MKTSDTTRRQFECGLVFLQTFEDTANDVFEVVKVDDSTLLSVATLQFVLPSNKVFYKYSDCSLTKV